MKCLPRRSVGEIGKSVESPECQVELTPSARKRPLPLPQAFLTGLQQRAQKELDQSARAGLDLG